VNFSSLKPECYASGSDDGFAKIWTTNVDRSIISIDTDVNVCSVAMSTTNANELVLGAAG
jgi:hypothetical protein